MYSAFFSQRVYLKVCRNNENSGKFEVLVRVSIKNMVFWDVMPCSSVDVEQHFRVTCCLHIQGRRVSSVEENGTDMGKRGPGLRL
jgi:hypothetical protein